MAGSSFISYGLTGVGSSAHHYVRKHASGRARGHNPPLCPDASAVTDASFGVMWGRILRFTSWPLLSFHLSWVTTFIRMPIIPIISFHPSFVGFKPEMAPSSHHSFRRGEAGWLCPYCAECLGLCSSKREQGPFNTYFVVTSLKDQGFGGERSEGY